MKKMLIATAFIALMTVQAIAVEINFSTVLVDTENQPLKDGDGKPLTLGRAAMLALMSPYPDDSNASADEKLKRGELALRVYQAIKLNLTVEEAAMVKKYIGKLYPPLVIVRALPLLEGGGRK